VTPNKPIPAQQPFQTETPEGGSKEEVEDEVKIPSVQAEVSAGVVVEQNEETNGEEHEQVDEEEGKVETQ